MVSAQICPNSDLDFYRFTGMAGQIIVADIDAEVNGSLLDSYIYLIDSDGSSILSEHDDEVLEIEQDSHLVYTLPHNGTYYLKVRDYLHPSRGGADYFYSLSLIADNTRPTGSITFPLSNSYLTSPNEMTISVAAIDSGSAVNRVEFLWHDSDWVNSDWVWLGADRDNSNGWNYRWDVSSIPDQANFALYIWIFDEANNWVGAGSWDLTLDRTPPTTFLSISPSNPPFKHFWVYWGGEDTVSGVANFDVQYRDGLNGEWTDWQIGTTNTYEEFIGTNGHTYYFRSRTHDFAGHITTYTNGNGDAQATIQVCPILPDTYETDNSYSIARQLEVNSNAQVHNIHVEGDEDWVKFEANSGTLYSLYTSNSGGNADTILYLYDKDGTTVLASNDDYPGMWPSSKIEWTAPTSGIYYAKVKHWDPSGSGCTTIYSLSIQEGNLETSTNVTFLPIILKQ